MNEIIQLLIDILTKLDGQTIDENLTLRALDVKPIRFSDMKAVKGKKDSELNEIMQLMIDILIRLNGHTIDENLKLRIEYSHPIAPERIEAAKYQRLVWQPMGQMDRYEVGSVRYRLEGRNLP